MRAVGVVDFEDDLILVVGLLDQVDVVLRIGGAKKALEFRGRNAVHAGAVAIDIDVEVRRVAKKIGARRRDETIVGAQLGAERIGRGVNFIRVDAAEDIAVAAELAASRADVDLQDRRRIQSRENSRDSADGFAQLRRDLFDAAPLLRRPSGRER